jgi:hypothetical protein
VREVSREYRDPVDVIWLETARRLGFGVERSRASYASYDGRGTITLGSADDLDADDHLGQMLLHEFCHALVQGPDALCAVDWGLSIEGYDAVEEYATHRVQAALADGHGLREFFAVTTDWRPYFDALPADPFAPNPSIADAALDQAAIERARAAWARALTPPWHEPLQEALSATAAVARATAPFARGASLWTAFR